MIKLYCLPCQANALHGLTRESRYTCMECGNISAEDPSNPVNMTTDSERAWLVGFVDSAEECCRYGEDVAAYITMLSAAVGELSESCRGDFRALWSGATVEDLPSDWLRLFAELREQVLNACDSQVSAYAARALAVIEMA